MFPWHHRWTVLAFTLLSQTVIIGIHTYSFAFWIVPWLNEFKVPSSQLMLIITGSLLASGLLAPFCGIALDKYPVHRVICVGFLVFAIGLMLVSVAQSPWGILILYSTLLALGMMIGGQLGSQALIARWFTSNRGAALGISALGIAFGGVLMPPIVTSLLAVFDWRQTFRWLALAAILLIPVAWVVLRKKPEGKESGPAAAGPAAADQPGWSTGVLLRNRDFWIIVFFFGAMFLSFVPLLYSMGVYARDLGISQQQAAWTASAGAFALGVGKFTFGKLADSVEFRRLCWFGSAGVVVFIAVYSVAESWLQLTAAFVILSFCFGGYIPLLSVAVVNCFGSASFGRVLGLVLTFVQLAAVSPFISGLIHEASGSYIVAFFAMASPLLVAMFALRWLTPRAPTGVT